MLRRATITCELVALAFVSTGAAAQTPTTPQPAPADTEVARIVVRRPTVVAFLVVPAGAVDTLPDFAVVADDWNYAMATLGDSLQKSGIDFALVTEPRLRLTSAGAADASFALDPGLATGYVFARPGETPCIRRGPADLDVVLAAARAYFGGERSRESRALAACGRATR